MDQRMDSTLEESEQELCFEWKHHPSSLSSLLGELLNCEALVDVTLACGNEGELLRAHKVVLSACSPFFRTILSQNPCQHPIVVLPDVESRDFRSLLHFMYHGQVAVPQSRMGNFLRLAKVLHISGLSEVLEGDKNNNRLFSENHSIHSSPSLRLQSFETSAKHQAFTSSTKHSQTSSKRKDFIKTDDNNSSHSPSSISGEHLKKPKLEPHSPTPSLPIDNSNEISPPLNEDGNDIQLSAPAHSPTPENIAPCDQKPPSVCDVPMEKEKEDEQPSRKEEDPSYAEVVLEVGSGEIEPLTSNQSSESESSQEVQELASMFLSSGGRVAIAKNHSRSPGGSAGIKGGWKRYSSTCNKNADLSHAPSKIPPTSGKKYPSRVCRMCPGRRETRWECARCSVALHPFPCFDNFHKT